MAALAAVILGPAFFSSRDDPTTAVAAPGEPASDPPRLAAELRAGNVVLEVAGEQARRAAQRLAREVGGDPTPELRAVGQAVLVRTPPGGAARECAREATTERCRLVTAYAHGRRLAAPADDPALRAFVEHWLGRGAR